jgi:hypothetical protein
MINHGSKWDRKVNAQQDITSGIKNHRALFPRKTEMQLWRFVLTGDNGERERKLEICLFIND